MRYFFLLTSVLLFSCNKTVDLPNVDELAWQNDVNGCLGNRMTMVENVISDKDLLKGLNQDQIISLLGKPDQNELYKRNQKFFIYNITATDCGEKPTVSPRKYLSLRFNATGLAKEVVVYQE